MGKVTSIWNRLPNQLPGKQQAPLKQSHFGGKYEKGSTEPINDFFTVELTLVHTAPVTLQTKFQIMQRVVANCTSMCIETMGKPLQHLLDLGSQVSLLQQAFFYRCLAPLLEPGNSELAEAYNFFSLTVANDESLPVTRYVVFDVTFLGVVVLKVGFLVAKNLKALLKTKNSGMEPGKVGIWRVC